MVDHSKIQPAAANSDASDDEVMGTELDEATREQRAQEEAAMASLNESAGGDYKL